MIYFTPCKINLGLNILSKRADGYHEISTCFYPIPWFDILEIIPAERTAFTFSGLSIPGLAEQNLCYKAFDLWRRKKRIPAIRLHLHKQIPMGAGLGGGSSDAAATFKILNTVFSLGLTPKELESDALKIGSDCPFFITPGPAMASGRGEVLTSFMHLLAGKFVVVVTPAIHVSSAEAYELVKPGEPQSPLDQILRLPLREWRDLLINDFEDPVFNMHPVLGEVKEKLYRLGAAFAGMSGSGSAVYGIFEQAVEMKGSFAGMSIWTGVL
jgi:4-diphosphocytidyl-2-C-methyl-D-erythritol kinase